MAPFIGFISLDRSSQVRIGRGPRNSVPSPMIPVSPAQSSRIRNAFYADLAQTEVRRDLQRHGMLGALQDVTVTSQFTASDFFKSSGGTGLVISAGSGMSVNVSAGQIASRTYGDRLTIAAVTNLAVAAAPAFGTRVDYVVVDNTGTVAVVTGGADVAAPTYEVQSFAIGGTAPTGGTWTYTFRWNNMQFTTGTIAWNAAGSAIATAMLAATGVPNGSANGAALSTLVGSGTLAGAGTALPTGPATVTASGALEGQITPVFADPSGLTGGANNVVNVTETTVGSGAQSAIPAGNVLILGTVTVANGASTPTAVNAWTLPTS